MLPRLMTLSRFFADSANMVACGRIYPRFLTDIPPSDTLELEVEGSEEDDIEEDVDLSSWTEVSCVAMDEATSVGVVDAMDSAGSDPITGCCTAFSVGGSMMDRFCSTAWWSCGTSKSISSEGCRSSGAS
jgi:hypothetical protein